MSPLSSSLPSLSGSLARPISHGAEMLCDALGGWTWGPALALAKPAILSVLSRIETGTLLLVDEPGQTRHVFGQKLTGELGDAADAAGLPRRATTVPRVEVVIKNEAFWMHLFLFADMSFPEAYMLRDFQCEDLTSFFQHFILNRDQMDNGTTWISGLLSAMSNLARTTNTFSNSFLNVCAHYDISNDMFAAFLSPDMTYSCPVWRRQLSPVTCEESLEDAQIRKLLRLIDGAHIKATDHVLEIGTGWGSLAIEAVRRTGCHVTSLTLSAEQKSLAEERVLAAGFRDRIDIKLMDYRNLPVPSTPYDKIVSIEMLENVGQEYLAT